MDKKGPGSLRGLGSFEGLHPPLIDLTFPSGMAFAPPLLSFDCLADMKEAANRGGLTSADVVRQ